MLTPEGPKIVEFNVRFGDPETQVVLPRLEDDLVDIVLAVAEGRPDDIELEWDDQWAVCVVLASAGYPGKYEKGKVILGVEDAEAMDGVTVFHAGTARNADGELVTWRPCAERGCAGQDVRRTPARRPTRPATSSTSRASSCAPTSARRPLQAAEPGRKASPFVHEERTFVEIMRLKRL